MRIRCCIALSLLVTFNLAIGQDSTGKLKLEKARPFLNSLNSRVSGYHSRLDRYLKKTYLMLQSIDKRMAAETLATSNFAGEEGIPLSKLIASGAGQQYDPDADTIATILTYLKQQVNGDGDASTFKEIDGTSSSLTAFSHKLAEAAALKQYLVKKRTDLAFRLQEPGLAKELKRLNKQAYYLDQQLKEFKSMLGDYRKVERKLLDALRSSTVFQKFMQKNSMLATLFPLPGNNSPSIPAIEGLQTREMLMNMIQESFGHDGQRAGGQFSQQLAQARQQIGEKKLAVQGGGNSDEVMPEGFKPNTQRTKSLLQRLEIGFNIQSKKQKSFLPITTDIGLSIGYRINDKTTVGAGASYKLGWGSDVHHIHLTHQGVGFRSFIDSKIRGTLWFSGGYERNFQSAFRTIDELRNITAWQQSGLLGLTKIVSLPSKTFSQTKIQLLWDMLSYQQVPATSPVVFRVGYYFAKN